MKNFNLKIFCKKIMAEISEKWILKFLMLCPGSSPGKILFEFKQKYPETEESRKNLNQILYKLLREKKITKKANADGTKPKWYCVSEEEEEKEEKEETSSNGFKEIKKLKKQVENLEKKLSKLERKIDRKFKKFNPKKINVDEGSEE